MPSLWIIDGFNFLRQSRDFVLLEAQSFEKAKQVLAQRLKNFAEFSGEPVLCVFDATGSVEFHRREEGGGKVRFLFTRGGETADEVIIEIASQKKQGAIVVSSDREVVQNSEKSGASTMSSQDFDRLLRRLLNGPGEAEDEESFDPKKGTQKKGPAHRRPKKERKVAAKIKKWI